MKTRPHLNITYLSERLQEALCDIFQYSVTTVTAPMATEKPPPSPLFSNRQKTTVFPYAARASMETAPPPSGKVSAGFFQEPPFIRSWQLFLFPQMRTPEPSFSSFWSRPLKKMTGPFALHRRSASIDRPVGFRPSFCSGQTRSAGISSDSGQPEPHFLPQ